MTAELKPEIYSLNGQTLFPVAGANGSLTAEVALYVVINGHRKEVRFTWQELHEAQTEEAIAAT